MRKITRTRLDAFLAKHATDMRTLDIGAGGSSYQRFFPNRVTVDIDPARKPDIVADAHALPFKDSELKVVLCTEMLEHAQNPSAVIAEIRRILAPGGMLILTTRFVYPLHDMPHDYWRFTRSALEMLFSDFSQVQIEAEAAEMTTTGILFERIILQSCVRGGKVTKALLLIMSRICTHLDWLVLARYSDIKHTGEIPELMTSGYYVIAKK